MFIQIYYRVPVFPPLKRIIRLNETLLRMLNVVVYLRFYIYSKYMIPIFTADLPVGRQGTGVNRVFAEPFYAKYPFSSPSRNERKSSHNNHHTLIRRSQAPWRSSGALGLILRN